MKKTVTVARTAFDLTHVNHLRVPEFAILSLDLKASGKTSKMYVPEWAPPAAAGGSDDFHFVPEFEPATIEFEIYDPLALAGEATLELFCRYRAHSMWTVKLSKLDADAFEHGKHSIKWDGRVVHVKEQAGTLNGDIREHDLTQFPPDTDLQNDFPDGFATLERTPYKLKLTLHDAEDDNIVAVAWTYFQILVKSLQIELGPEAAIPKAGVFAGDRHAMDIAVYRTLTAGVPAVGAAPLKIYLPSNLYTIEHWYTSKSEMDNNTGFDVYKDLWDDGPRIPIIAKIRLLSSADAEVKCELGPGAKALGRTPFLWEWINEDESLAGQSQPLSRTFLSQALNYYKNGTDPRSSGKDHTYPKGDNCHVDRGGKRGPGEEPIFPEQDGYSPQAALKNEHFPFKVEACQKRKWSALSYAWTSGALVGQTGVLFQPTRMGGDHYRLAAYAGWDRTEKDKVVLDTKDEPIQAPAAIMAQTGPFQVWREIHAVRYIRKLNTIADFVSANFANVQGAYREAYIELVNKVQAADNYILAAPKYNADAEKALLAAGNAAINDGTMVARGANHAGTAAEFMVNTWAQFSALWPAAFAAQNPGHPNPAAGAANALVTKGWNAGSWPQTVRDAVDGPADELLQHLPILDGAKDGITIIHFNFTISIDDATLAPGGNHAGVTNGEAIQVKGSTRNRCAFVYWNTRFDTFMHEIGHQLFLPHSQNAGGEQVERHDAADANCMMSYNRPRNSFCGLCQLRLRGWDPGPNSASDSKLKKNGPSNTKP